MTTLITGGTGRTGGSLARLLHAAKLPFIVATRGGKSSNPAYKAITFDWYKPATFENAFADDVIPAVDRVYLIPPNGDLNMATHVNPFIDLAIAKGIKRFVLLTSTQTKPGGPALGKIYQYLLDKGVDYTVLKPSWFIQNFGTNFVYSIKEKDEVFSATGEGKIPWVSTEDIAQSAFDALTAEKSPNTAWYLLGPELHSYDEAVGILSSVLGRKITHKKNTPEVQEATYKAVGVPADLARLLTYLEGLVKEGQEAEFVNAPAEEKYVGKHTLEQFFRENRDLWIKQ